MAPTKLHATTSFRWTLGFLALLALAMGLIVPAVTWRTNDLLTSQTLQVVAAEGRSLNEQFRNGGLPLLVQTVNERSQLPGSNLYLLADQAGARLAGNLDALPAELRNEPTGGVFHYRRRTDNPEARRMAVGMTIRVVAGPGDTTTAHLVIGRDIEDIGSFAHAVRNVFLAGLAALSLLALGAAALHSRWLLRRVDQVTLASQRIMAGDLTQRLPLNGTRDEMDRLVVNLNQMLERIEQLLNGLREVSDNIAHDLKTPLTRLRNRAEAALRDPRGTPALRQGLERTLEESDELIKTFNALLSIARMEAGAGLDRVDILDLPTLVRDAVDLYEPVAEETGLRIAASLPPHAVQAHGPLVAADRQLIGQALANLIENALKYGCTPGHGQPDAPDAADITVAVSTRPGWGDIIVSDRGPGIPAGDRERVLRRFVRLEQSRTQPGTGLGLSLVAAVARLHKGTLRLEDNAPGLRVILSLPTAPTHPTMTAA